MEMLPLLILIGLIMCFMLLLTVAVESTPPEHKCKDHLVFHKQKWSQGFFYPSCQDIYKCSVCGKKF